MADVVEKTVEWADTGEFKLTTRESFKDLLYVKWRPYGEFQRNLNAQYDISKETRKVLDWQNGYKKQALRMLIFPSKNITTNSWK